MINANLIRAKIAENGMTQKELAAAMNISEKTLSLKMKSGSFNIHEADRMIEILKIENPERYFFANRVACNAT